ncbi:hypothetical protein JB92DRAFT_3307074 [Gautieria morchelliformis]|nr:hypothetical protein JB92DRAFT_3307074 [Gautieria morchelliformis]
MSELLGGITRALTPDVDAAASSTVYVTKHINDHVLWHSALNPWRRDPQWLVIHVALQTSLLEWKIDGQYGYKAFTTYVLARALEKASEAKLDHHLLYTMNVKIATRIWKLKSLDHTGFPFKYIVDQSHMAISLDNPEQFSCVFLIISELWVALDEMAVEAIPLLREYSPEFSIVSFEPLLLPTLCQMRRLRAAETHLSRRHADAIYRGHSLFEFIHHRDSFDARYFQTDLGLHKLRRDIEWQAAALKAEKQRECVRRNEEYHRLKRENDLRSHTSHKWVD